VDASGANARPMMSFFSLAGPQMSPVFTPDGNMIAFSSQHATYGTASANFEIYTFSLEGERLAQRTTGGGQWPAFIAR
jgi:Tol biopolymer transport system component